MANHSLRVRGAMVARFGLPSGSSATAISVSASTRTTCPRRWRRSSGCARGCSSYEAKYRFADSMGGYHWLLSRGRVLEHDPDTGAARVLAGTHVDIDALKRVEEELREATLQAQAASEARAGCCRASAMSCARRSTPSSASPS